MIKKYWGSIVNNLIKRRKLSDFIVFIMFASVLWLLIKLSESHVAELNYQINYVSVPEDKLLLGEPERSLNVVVTGVGYAIIKNRLLKKQVNLDISQIEETDGSYLLTTQFLEEAIKAQLDKDITFKSIAKKSIRLQLGKNSIKRIPVVPDLALSFERDFDIYGSLTVTPDSITVKGPENIVDTLNAIKTNTINLEDINSDIFAETNLLIPETLYGVSFSQINVEVQAKVVRFTEKIIEIPIIITDKPDQITIRLFPETVNVKCVGSLSDLKKVLPNDLMVTADFKEAQETGVLIPEVKKYPPYLRSAKIIDKKIEFLIKKE